MIDSGMISVNLELELDLEPHQAMANDEGGMLPTRPPGASSFMKASFNAINLFLGVSFLTIPYALSNGGWLSLVLFISVAGMTFYTGILISRCMEVDPRITSYFDIAERAFGKKGRILVMLLMNAEIFLVAAGFLILEGDNLHKLFPDFTIQLGSLTMNGPHSFVILTALVLSPSMVLTDLSMLSYISVTGVFSCLIITVSLFCIGAFGGAGFHAKGSQVLNINTLPNAISLFIFSFGGHSVIPSIYASMRDARQFSKALFFSFVPVTLNYMTVGILGYLMYGSSVESEITLNLPTSTLSAKVVIYTTLLLPVTRYPLVLTPVASSIEVGLPQHYKTNKFAARLLIRMVLLISTVVVAYFFPYYESLMAIVGSVFIVSLSFLFPCMCYRKIYHLSWTSWSSMGISGVAAFGIVAGILGTYSSIYTLVR